MKMTSIAEIKALLFPKDFYQIEGLDIKGQKADGWVCGGLCPFHNDKHKGNFRVNLSTGAFKCFACRAKGSDIFAFLMLRYGLTFKEAMNCLREQYMGVL